MNVMAKNGAANIWSNIIFLNTTFPVLPYSRSLDQFGRQNKNENVFAFGKITVKFFLDGLKSGRNKNW